MIRLIDRIAEIDEFYRAGVVAIDTIQDHPLTGDRTGHETEIIGTKADNTEYAYQWVTVQRVGGTIPLVLDARPIRKGDRREEIVTSRSSDAIL